MEEIELLSPAGSLESVEAAVQGGANAVYLGYGDFNARRNAKNFTKEELAEAVDYCHLRGVDVHLTLNTLLRGRELPMVEAMLQEVLPLGVDALIVQDMGVLSLVKKMAPHIPLHASTQCAIHSLDGVKQAADWGFSRVVLARELSDRELSYIADHSPLPLEVFVHGALCMSYSGQCFFSAMVGERSGNRGLCAQACRLPYRCGKTQGYPLSLKDMSMANHLQRLEAMGIASLKIEGRMKRPEYVYLVTKIYAAALRENRSPSPEEFQILEDVFSRQGFTDGYFQENLGKEMFGVRENQAPPKDLFAQGRREYQGKNQRKIPISYSLEITDKVNLTLWDEKGNRVSGEIGGVEEARQKPLTEEVAKDQLSRTGDTPYTMVAESISIRENVAIPLVKPKNLRKDLLEEISALRTEKKNLPLYPVQYTPSQKGEKRPLQWTISVHSATQVTEELLAEKPSLLYLPMDTEEKIVQRCHEAQIPLCVKIPDIRSDQEREGQIPLLEKWKSWGVTEALVGTLDSLHFAKGFALRGDYGLNLTNDFALAQYGDLCSALPSFELNLAQIRDLDKKIPLELLVYGNLPLMTSKNSMIWGKSGKTSENQTLTDRKNISFPVEQDQSGRWHLYNALPLYLGDKDLSDLGLWAGRLSFTKESPEDCAVICRTVKEGKPFEKPMTRGLYYRNTL
ncbi:MAG: U32 family peptidase [Eubacteriales bacterium]